MQNTQQKIIDDTKSKIKIAESKIKEADNNLKIEYIKRVEINSKISKATPAELLKGNLKEEAAKVEESIHKNKIIVEETTTTITTGINQQAHAREEIIKTKEVANEAQLISIQTQLIEELVQAQVNQSQQIEIEIEGELTKDFNQTSETVKRLVKEQTTMTQQKLTSKKIVKEASKRVETETKEIKEIITTISEKTTEKEKLTVKLNDPANAAISAQI